MKTFKAALWDMQGGKCDMCHYAFANRRTGIQRPFEGTDRLFCRTCAPIVTAWPTVEILKRAVEYAQRS